jgi:hypothetical protein
MDPSVFSTSAGKEIVDESHLQFDDLALINSLRAFLLARPNNTAPISSTPQSYVCSMRRLIPAEQVTAGASS